MNDTCDTFNQDGCGLYASKSSLFNFIYSVIVNLLGAFILLSNTVILICYVKFKNDSWNFISFCIIELIVINIMSAFECFLMAITFCLNYLDSETFCLLKYCVNYFLLLMIFKVNFCMSAGRLVQVRSGNALILNTLFVRLAIFIFPPIILFFTLTPLILRWNNFNSNCDCTLNYIMPGPYILSINFICIILALLTTIIYAYIYRFVKTSVKATTTIRTMSSIDLQPSAVQQSGKSGIRASIHHRLHELRKKTQSSVKNDKIQVLRIQTVMFFLLLASSLPFLVLTSYEKLAGIKRFHVVTNVRNFMAILLLLDPIVKPVLFTYRLEFMRRILTNLRGKRKEPIRSNIES